MSSEPTPQEQILISDAIKAGRSGAATITLLAHAHDAASRHNMTATVKELRSHIYNLLPREPPPLITHRMVLSSILIGLVSGLATAFIFSKTRIKQKLGILKEA